MTDSVTLGIVAWLITAALTPVVICLGRRYKFVDQPDGARKLHQVPVPLGGGLAILAGLLVTLLIASVFFSGRLDSLAPDATGWLGLLAACLVVCLVGFIDDAMTLRGRQKLVGQILAVVILMSSGFMIKSVRVFEWPLDLGLLAIPFTVFWLLGAMNALNLIDGIDGLATTIGVILTATIAILVAMNGRGPELVVACLFLGAVVGFLPYNLPPARIFLGDTGSMLIGLVAGALAIRASLKGPATVALAAPLAIWTIPILDSLAAILRRRLTGQSIYVADREHLHHVLQRRGLSGLRTLAVISLLCLATSLGTLASVWLRDDRLAIAAALAVVGMLVVSGLFGHSELRLLASKLKGFVSSVVHLGLPRQADGTRPRHERLHLRGERDWDRVWDRLLAAKDQLGLESLRLHVQPPGLTENFHAQWNRGGRVEPAQQWHVLIPLVVDRRVVGRLECGGHRQARTAFLQDLDVVLREVEAEVAALILEAEAAAAPAPEPLNVPAATLAAAASATPLARSSG